MLWLQVAAASPEYEGDLSPNTFKCQMPQNHCKTLQDIGLTAFVWFQEYVVNPYTVKEVKYMAIGQISCAQSEEAHLS